MALPKHRHSSTRQAKRRTHYKITAPAVVDCPQCKSPKLAHHACKNCGYYAGRPAIIVSKKTK